MKIHQLLIIGALTVLSSNAQSAYQYTYTGEPFSFLYNLQGGEFTGSALTDHDGVTIVIKSNQMLNTSTKFITDASVEFFSGDYYKKAVETDFSGPIAKLSQLEISSYDANGLPQTWSLQFNEFTNTELIPDYAFYEGYGFSSYSDGSYVDDSASYIVVEPIAQEDIFTTYGQSNTVGKWTMTQIEGPVSAVPELPESVMLLSGIGIVGYLAGRKKSKQLRAI